MGAKTSLLLLTFVLAFAILAGCAGAPAASTEDDMQAISAIFDQYIRTLETYDAEGWMALWDENGVQLPPNSPMFVGKDAIRAGNYDGIKDSSGVFNMSITIQEYINFGTGYSMARGVYGWKWSPKDGSAASDYDGKFMTLFHKQSDGSWRIFRDCFNSNRPTQ